MVQENVMRSCAYLGVTMQGEEFYLQHWLNLHQNSVLNSHKFGIHVYLRLCEVSLVLSHSSE